MITNGLLNFELTIILSILLTNRSVSMPKTKITKEELLEKCWYFLHRNGYYHTSLRDLAEEVGLGKAGLLHHFGSKEGLMHAVLEFAIVRYHDYVLSVAKEDLPLEQRLEKMLRRQNRLAKIDGRGCFFGNLIAETSQQKIFNENITEFINSWRLTLHQVLSEKLPDKQAEEMAYLTIVEHQGAVILYKLSVDESHLEQFVHRTLKRFQQLTHETNN